MKYSFALLFIILISFTASAQAVFVEADNNVYEFLERLSAKGVFSYSGVIKPQTRMFIAGKLVEADSLKSMLTSLEKEELEFFKKEYFDEIRKLNNEEALTSLEYLSFGHSERFRVFSYSSPQFSIYADPIIGYDVSQKKGERIIHGRNGADLYASFSDNLALQINFSDNIERGKLIDLTRSFSEKTGYNFRKGGIDALDYDNTNASISYSWNWGNIAIAKDYMQWGSGTSGQIILSDKAPSFPMVRLDAEPTDWLRFVYVHGYLSSNLIDSTTRRVNTDPKRFHSNLIEKYYVAHILEVKPLSNMSVSLGESVVYSDRFEPIYLIPILFFRMAEHYLNYKDENAGNAQIFGNVAYNFTSLKTKLYSSIFLDELNIGALLEGKGYMSAAAYTAGFIIYDPFISDMELNFEYTRINPFVYFHIDDAQGYTNYNYQMGHWIGSNGDQVYLSLSKTFIRGLKLTVYGEFIRKGQKELRTEPRYKSYQTFLYGLRTNYSYYGFNLRYEVMHNLTARLDFKSQHSPESYNELTTGFSYGF